MYRRAIRQLIDPVAETAPFRTSIVAIDGADADSFTADGTGGEGEATGANGNRRARLPAGARPAGRRRHLGPLHIED